MVNKNFESFKKGVLNKFIIDLKNEWNYQDLKFPNQTHTIEMWMIIVMEEIGEICKEITEKHNINIIRKEMIQAITLLIRITYSPCEIKSDNKLTLIM